MKQLAVQLPLLQGAWTWPPQPAVQANFFGQHIPRRMSRPVDRLLDGRMQLHGRPRIKIHKLLYWPFRTFHSVSMIPCLVCAQLLIVLIQLLDD